ncbi:MAG TPA: phosphate signaling complex protein PhoU [Candidatus Thermoplasmatota archaeon]|nr:phosphate signaling complex protein PhoU [Candidatus Thermoplasmatota archaeon]
MTRQFHHQLDEMRKHVLDMGEMAKRNLLNGTKSLTDLDVALAEEVIALDASLNKMDVSLEAEILNLIARHQPMGTDLRTLGASLKIITYLDRIGRYGYDIAKVTKEFGGKSHVRKLVAIPLMAKTVGEMVDNALLAYKTSQAQPAREVFAMDETVDALYDQVFRQCVTFMLEDPATISQCAHYILVARHLERAGDNACKVAEKTKYMITGERRLPNY